MAGVNTKGVNTAATVEAGAMAWIGWYRRRESEPWTRAVEAPTLEEASRKLSAATKGMRLRSTDYILTGGAYPRVGARLKGKAQ